MKLNETYLVKNKIAVIFDLDGVIVNTAKYHYIAWKEIANKLGFDFTEKNNERLKGVSRMDSLEILLKIGKKELSQHEKEEIAKQKNDLYKVLIKDIKPYEILPGVKNLLEKIRSEGILTAIGSASKNATIILEKLSLISLFDAIIDGNNISKAKPHPEIFLKAAKKLKVIPKNCLVFEDAEAGIEAAINAGMKCIGVGSIDVLKKADLVISGLDKINFNSILKILSIK